MSTSRDVPIFSQEKQAFFQGPSFRVFFQGPIDPERGGLDDCRQTLRIAARPASCRHLSNIRSSYPVSANPARPMEITDLNLEMLSKWIDEDLEKYFIRPMFIDIALPLIYFLINIL